MKQILNSEKVSKVEVQFWNFKWEGGRGLYIPLLLACTPGEITTIFFNKIVIKASKLNFALKKVNFL